VVFHFNKASLMDPTIPPWVLKCKGESWYVNHVECNVPWSTKETPDNSHTKGSIKVKEVLLTIDENNEAKITNLTIFDKIRLRNQKLGITRIMFRPHTEIHKALQNNEVKHSPFKNILGRCATGFVVCDILKESDMTFLTLKYGEQFRVLKPNESYYQEYDDVKGDHIKVDYSHPDTPFEYS
jgi:hypothetical protein